MKLLTLVIAAVAASVGFWNGLGPGVDVEQRAAAVGPGSEVVLLAAGRTEVVEGHGGKHCAWVDLGSAERIVLMEELHASRCDLYFHWNASLARPRIVGRNGSPVRLHAHLLPVDRRGVELIATLEGSKQRLLGVVAESKELAVQGLVEWIECSDELDIETPCTSSSSDSSRSSG